MSSRVLRKVQTERQKGSPENEPVSDTEPELPIGGARRKQFNVNRYDLEKNCRNDGNLCGIALEENSHIRKRFLLEVQQMSDENICISINLNFLRTTFEQRQTTTSLVPTPQTVEEELAEQVAVREHPSDTEQRPVPRTSTMHRRQSNSFEPNLQKIVEKKSSTAEDFDDDKHFLLCLLPTLKKFDDNTKLRFRIEIMNAIKKVQDEISTQKTHSYISQQNKNSEQLQLQEVRTSEETSQRQNSSSQATHGTHSVLHISPCMSEVSFSNPESSDIFY